MTDLTSIGVGAALLVIAGLAIGFAIGRLTVRKQATKAQSELDAYRRQVTEHFGQTAEHFQEIGRQYTALYEHMASGAEELCDTKNNEKQISFAPGGLIAAELAADADNPDLNNTLDLDDALELDDAQTDALTTAKLASDDAPEVEAGNQSLEMDESGLEAGIEVVADADDSAVMPAEAQNAEGEGSADSEIETEAPEVARSGSATSADRTYH